MGDIINEFIIPENNGYWRDGECLFLKNPLGLKGVFSYYLEDYYKHSYESSSKIPFVNDIPYLY